MRILDIICERTAYSGTHGGTHGGYAVIYGNHFKSRQLERKIPDALITGMIARLPRVRTQLANLKLGDQINLYDRQSGVHIVVQLADDKRLTAVTAYRNDNYNGQNNIITVR